MKKFDTPAVIFAGGKSSRMGQDKALLPFAGYNTLSEFQYRRLSALFERVYISSRTAKFDFETDIILDRYEACSPLVGIVSVFETLEVDEVFILSVDAPFVDAEIIKTLMGHPKEHDAIIAKSTHGIQPLCGRYSHSILPLAQQQLKTHNHRLGDLLKKAHTCFITFENDKPFTNLNHLHEYEEAIESLTFS